MTYQRVQAHYNNPYDFTVYVEVIDEQGKQQTIVSNKIHPFFTQVSQGELVPSSEGHFYKGEIQNAQWVDAQNLKAGYKLLSENNHWQTVKGVSIKAEKLSAYNLTVETDHTPKNIQELLSNPDFRRGIDKGLNYLGEKK